MPSLKNIKITYSSPPSPTNSSPPTPPCDEPNPPPPPPAPNSTCSPCQHKNHRPPTPTVARPPPPPGAARPPPPPFVAPSPPPPCANHRPPPPPLPLSVVSPPPPQSVSAAPPPPPQSVSAPPPAAVTAQPPPAVVQTPKIQPSILVPAAAPWIYPATAQSPYFAPPPLAAQGGGNTGLIVGTSLSGLFFLSFLAFGLNFLAKKMLKRAPATSTAETQTGLNLKDPASDVENPAPPQYKGEAVPSLSTDAANIEEGPPKDQNPVPHSNESGDPHKNDKSKSSDKSEDPQQNEKEKEDHDRKKKSTDGLVKMLKVMKMTLLLMTEPGYQKSMAPAETTSTVEDGNDALEEEEEEEEETNDDIEEEEAGGSGLPQNKYKESKGIRSKTLEDSKMPVLGRPAPRDSNRSKKAKTQSKSTTVNPVPTPRKMVKPFVDKQTVNDGDATNIEDERQDDDQALGEIEADKEKDELEETEGDVEEIDRNKEGDELDEGDIDADIERDELDEGEGDVGDIDDIERDELDEGEGDVGDIDVDKEREELDEGEGEGKADEAVVPRNIEEKDLQEHEAKQNKGEKGGPIAKYMKPRDAKRVKRANKTSPSSNVVMTPAQRKAAMPLAKKIGRGGGEDTKTEDDPDSIAEEKRPTTSPIDDTDKGSGVKKGEEATEQPVDGGGNDDNDYENIAGGDSLQGHANVSLIEMDDFMSAMGEMNPLASIGLGSHWNEIVKLVKTNHQLLQALKKKNERMQRKIDTLTALSVPVEHRAPNPNLLQGTEQQNDYDDDADQGTEPEPENEDKADESMQETGQDEEMMNDEKDLLIKQDEGMLNDDNVEVKKQTLPQESKEEQDLVNFSGLNEKKVLKGKKDVLKQIPVNENKTSGKRGSNPSSKTGATTGSTTAVVKRGGKSQEKKMVNEDDVVSQQENENAGELPQETEQVQGNGDNDAEGLPQETEQMQGNDDDATELQHETVPEQQNDEIPEEIEQLQENDDDPGEETEQGQENDDSATDLPHNPEQGEENYYNPEELPLEKVNEDDANLPQDSNEDEGMMDVSGESKRLVAGIKKKVDKQEFNPSGKTQFQKGKSNSAAKKGGVLEKQQVIATTNLSTSSALSGVMGFAASNEDEGILSFTNQSEDNEDEARENKESEHNIIADGLDTVGSMEEKIPTDLQQLLKRKDERKKSVASKHPSTKPPHLPTTVGNIELEGISKFINPQELAKGDVLGQPTGEIKDLLHKEKHKGKKPGGGKATTKRQTPGMDDFNKTRELFQGKIDQESQPDAETTTEINDGADEEVEEEEIAEEGVAAAEEEEVGEEEKDDIAEEEVTAEEEEGVEEEATKEESNATTI